MPHTHTHTHPCHTHAHTHTHATHAHTHTPMPHTDWAFITCTCSDFGLLFLTLFSHSVQLRECTHLHCYVNSLYTIFVTHTQSEIVPLAMTLGSYFSHCFHKAYMCMNVHTCLHTHTHTHTQTYTRTHTHTHTGTGLVQLAGTLGSYVSLCFHKATCA